ncbi:MAG: ubiquitin-conjugating enzyme E2 [Fervidobacterium sp.]
MKIFVQIPIGPSTGLAEVDVLPEHTIGEVKQQICASMSLDATTVALMYGGQLLDDNLTISQAGIPENAQLALMPWDIIAGISVARLVAEKEYIQRQFPLVSPVNDPPTLYEGMVRCEEGPVKELASKGIWPFTEYVQWHRFKMELPAEYPVKPPTVTWISEISHPNIVPNIPGAVCVSVIGKGWNPNLRLTAVINSLYYLLVDPNPDNVFNHPSSLKAAQICKEHGFPMKGKKLGPSSDIVRFNLVSSNSAEGRTSEGDVVHFNVIPLPENKSRASTGDVVHFKVFRGKNASE